MARKVRKAPGRRDAVHKFDQKPEMTTEEMYRFFYGSIIPALREAQKDGGEAFIRSLTRGSVNNIAEMIGTMAKGRPVRDARALAELYRAITKETPYDKSYTYEVTELSDRVLELKFTECLPAKLLRAMGAADIGCALECCSGEGIARAFNPAMRFTNPRNMMKGHDHCIERYELET